MRILSAVIAAYCSFVCGGVSDENYMGELHVEQRPCVDELISYLHDSIMGYVPLD